MFCRSVTFSPLLPHQIGKTPFGSCLFFFGNPISTSDRGWPHTFLVVLTEFERTNTHRTRTILPPFFLHFLSSKPWAKMIPDTGLQHAGLGDFVFPHIAGVSPSETWLVPAPRSLVGGGERKSRGSSERQERIDETGNLLPFDFFPHKTPKNDNKKKDTTPSTKRGHLDNYSTCLGPTQPTGVVQLFTTLISPSERNLAFSLGIRHTWGAHISMVPATHGMCPPSTPGQAENMEREGQICTTNGLQGTTGLDAMPSLSLLARYAKTYTNTQQKNGTSPTQQTEHARMDNVDSCFENLIFVTWVINSFLEERYARSASVSAFAI
ncbi:hypothetical protein LY78DRAFT_143524 [Colletotrichum sublineola]|nr:hypothetical protein LY78DRAFT_143524 [Colletotrichum sublineola]